MVLASAFFRKRPVWIVWPSSAIALLGVWLLNGAQIEAFVVGDWMVLASAFFFALHVTLIGLVVSRTRRPILMSAIQYAFLAICGLSVAGVAEGFTLDDILRNLGPIAYAGIVSGGVAYTLQAIAQQHSPPSDAAIILSGEALFAALAGYLILEEMLDPLGVVGCVLIMCAILAVEGGALLKKASSS